MKEKILLVFDKGLGYGGVETIIMNIVRRLSGKFSFDLLTNTSQEKAFDKEFLSFGGRILRIPFYEGSWHFRRRLDYYIRGYYLYTRTLAIIKKNMPYKVVHCNNVTEGGVVLAAARKAGIPIRIMHSHAVFSPDVSIRKFITEKYRKLIMKNATCLLGCSKEACNLFYENTYDVILNNFYDNTKFRWSPSDIDFSSSLRLIQVGRFDQIKNQIFSLNILKSILSAVPDATLDLVGGKGDEAERELRQLADELGIMDKLHFYSVDSDIPVLLKKANVFLLPSLSEGFGIALIEAQAIGLKCYASDTVPCQTNCGGVDYLPLSVGASKWAQKIVSDYLSGKCVHQKYDCTKYSVENIIMEYDKLYCAKL